LDRYIYRSIVYTGRVAKHLVDIDEQALRDARVQLGAKTIKETVNRALRLIQDERGPTVEERLDLLAGIDFLPREQAWH
jgi:Arc/MetJ family transcription regulator